MQRVYDKLADDESGKQDLTTLEVQSGLQSSDFTSYVEETRNQPPYRASMDKCADYYDGNQLTPEILTMLDNMGLSSLMTNLIKPTIDTVLGIEAKNRTDFRMASDDDKHQAVAEALSLKLAEAERESRADRACSDAYAGQIKAGLSWVHIGRNSDPFGYKYKAENIHRREMFWDWSAKDYDLSDARYVIRQKWFPIDQVVAAMPQHKAMILGSGGGWQPDWMQRAVEDVSLANAIDQETRMSSMAWEWRNIDARRIALQECWYATYIRGLILRLPSEDGSGEERVVEFDRKNPLHMAAVQRGFVRPEPAVYRKLRASIWLGPHKLQDVDPGRNKLPYVPFWGFREDLTGVPYGLVRAMVPLQDEINARRRRLMWLLSSKRVSVDSDALDVRFTKYEDLANEIARPDSMTILNPDRKNKDALKVETDLGLSQQQFEVLLEAKEGIQAVAGIFNSLMGKTDGAKSGIAVNALVEQSSNTLGEINDNFKMSRQRVGELLVELIRQDMSGKQVTVVAGANTSKRKVISLNKPVVDEVTGVKYFENDTDRSNCKVALEEVPSTPAYRAQSLLMIGETLKSLPPELQAPLMPFFLEASDLPQREDMANTLRKQLGLLGDDGQPQDPQVAMLKQQLQALQQQSEEMANSYEQAVKEQTDKATALEAANNQLKLQVSNKAAELQVRMKELEISQTAAQGTAETTAADRELKGKELEMKQTEMATRASESSSNAELKRLELQHKAAELELKQLELANAHNQDAAPADMTPEQQIAHEQELAHIKGDIAVDTAVKVAKINTSAKTDQVEIQAEAQAKVAKEQAKVAKAVAAAKPKPAAAKPAAKKKG